jgi:hypothetical protein
VREGRTIKWIVSCTNEDTPHLVNSDCAIALAISVLRVVFESAFEAGTKTNHNNGTSELNKSLIRSMMTVEIPRTWPKPCMAKTAPIIAPLHLVVANLDTSVNCKRFEYETYSEVIIEESG